MSTVVSPTEIEEKEATESTYFDPARMLRICSACEILSWFALALGVFALLAGVWVLFQQVVGTLRMTFQVFMSDSAPLMLVFGLVALICLFFWVFLRAISEGLYLLMDIQDGLQA